jgi:alpha-L-fucosidase
MNRSKVVFLLALVPVLGFGVKNLRAVDSMVNAPQPFGAVPSPRQLAWSRTEKYAFVHFSINTFTDKEWGYGDESEKLFNPSDFDADQIVGAAKTAGLRGVILTCKHHDGFCLWPSAYTTHSIKNSPWRDGKGDVVREISDACHRQGLKFGVYLSPWDRNSSMYGKPEYITYYRNQLRELLTNYGPIFEVWFDGANGGDGFYGGAREMRKIDRTRYYDWPNTIKLVRNLQPDACIFSDCGPDTRWCGNEDGSAGDPCWQTLNAAGLYPGKSNTDQLNHGDRDGTSWIPAEVDVSIRPGWFYHKKEDTRVKTPEQLTKIYFESVGRGANLILNLPPDRRGRIPDADVDSLMTWNRFITETFATNLAEKATVTADQIRGGSASFAGGNLLDASCEKYWTTDDQITSPQAIIDLPKPQTFNVIRICEAIELGQRVDAAEFDAWDGSTWKLIASCSSIGPRRLILLPAAVTASRLRLRVLRASACPALTGFGLFHAPELGISMEGKPG